MAVVGESGEIAHANRVFADLVAADSDELEGAIWHGLIEWAPRESPPEGPGRFIARAREQLSRWLEVDIRRLDEERSLLTLRDASLEQRESERRLSTMLQTFPGVAYRCRNDRRWTMEFVSQGALPLTGYPPSAFLQDEISFTDLTHSDDVDPLWEQVQQAVREGQQFGAAYRLRTRLDQEKWVWEQGVGVFDEDGELVAIEGYILDVTEEYRAREALQESRESLSRPQPRVPVT